MLLLLLSLSCMFSFISCSSDFKDPRNGKVYKTVQIGNQVWMAENLNLDVSGSWGYDSSYTNKYGRLYSWDAAKHIAPQGWHLPSKSDYDILLKNLGSQGTSAFDNIIKDDPSGFKALFSGFCNFGSYSIKTGESALFWSSTEVDGSRAFVLEIFNKQQMVPNGYVCLSEYKKDYGFSVRLIKD